MNWLPAFGIALIVTAPGQKDAPKDQPIPPIVGTWNCVKIVAGGQEFPDPKDRAETGAEFMADGKFHIRFGESIEGTYKKDTAKDPAVLEITDSKKGTKKMIYKVEKDTLVICWADGDRDCPTKFESPAGMRIVLMTFSRGEKKKD
jgi:uncharacterized protein (TIGR03067 family)